MLDFLIEPAFWCSLVLLIGIELVLGADNANVAENRTAGLPEEQRRRALALTAAISTIVRLALLAILLWLLGLERTAFDLAGWAPNWGQIVLLAGGLFLVYKAVTELHLLVEPRTVPPDDPEVGFYDSPTRAIVELVTLSVLFSVDSIILAVGMTAYVPAMVIAIPAAVVILFFASGPISAFLVRHPAVRALAFGILFVIGTVLMAEGLGMTVLREYLYIPMIIGALLLALSKLIHRPTADQDGGPAMREQSPEPRLVPVPAVMPIEERAEPSLEPAILVPEAFAEPQDSIEPLLDDEPDGALEDDEFSGADDQIHVAEETAVEEFPEEDEPPLGEGDAAVPRSRRKKTVLRRRPPRLRTARRRE